jgi:acyl-coenzyme A synthetase/AMP-(fatty) acid ligase
MIAEVAGMYLFDTHRSAGRRLRLALNRNLGAGNFFWHACRVAPDLDEPILFHHPGGVEPIDGTRSYSLRELRSTVARYVNWYTGHGVGPASVVGLYTAHGLRGLLHHIAITSLGATDALANPNLAASVAADYFQRCQATVIVGDAERLTACGHDLPNGPLLADVDTIEREAKHPGRPVVRPPYRHRPGDLVMISHSSGTTGRPKPTTFTHQGFFVGKRERLWRFPSRRADRMLSALPHSHSAGISYLSLALLLGLPTFMIDDRSGRGVADAMNHFRPTVVLGFPLSLAELPIDELSADASSAVHTWMGMGDASHERHIRPLTHIGRRPVRGGWLAGSTYVDGLGSSEMGMVLFKNAHTPGSDNFRRMIGRPVPVVKQAAVLAPDGTPVPAGQPGLLGVRTPSVTPGYWDDPELTRQYRSGGYFLTGDVVSQDAAGNWYHLDRTPDVISTVDGPVHSLPLEEVVLNTTGALDAAVVAADDPDGPDTSRPIAVVLFAGPHPEDPDGLLALCNTELERAGLARLRAIVVAADRDGLPVGVTGKVLKRVLRERHRMLLLDPSGRGVAVRSR